MRPRLFEGLRECVGEGEFACFPELALTCLPSTYLSIHLMFRFPQQQERNSQKYLVWACSSASCRKIDQSDCPNQTSRNNSLFLFQWSQRNDPGTKEGALAAQHLRTRSTTRIRGRFGSNAGQKKNRARASLGDVCLVTERS
jgi:hypothetical protein